ncbi:MAG TPA: S9 family peptidase [Steroidobacteraceae bacterium]|nr:S9 family peptidase [Steroidobacteraceae bacterium]
MDFSVLAGIVPSIARAAGAALLALLATYANTALAEQRAITDRDLYDFVWVADPQVASDGGRVAFVRVTVNDDREGYDTAIWSVSTSAADAPHPLTAGRHDSAPRWSPDGKYLLFLRGAEHDGKPVPPQLWLLPMSGGDAFPITDLPKGAGNPVWSPDGKLIAFTSATNAEDLAKQQKQHGARAEAPKEPESDVHVITRAYYRGNDEGYLDPKHPEHIWLVDTPLAADARRPPRPLTSGRFDEGNIVWSDAARLYFTTTRLDEPYYELPRSELYSIGVTGGEPRRITTIDMDVNVPALSPDGKRLAFIAEPARPIRSYSQPHLWVLDLAAPQAPRDLTQKFDWDVGSGVFGDNAPPRAAAQNPPVWAPDGSALIEIYSKQGRTNLARFDVASGAESDLTSGDQAITNWRPVGGSGKLLINVSTPTHIDDLFLLDPAARASPLQLTHANDSLFGKLELTEPEELWYTSFDGKRIQAWLQKPLHFDARRKYPLILDIHGGPHTAYGYVFDHEFQWLAAKGYLVLYPNPRGSTSYGEAFGNVIQYHYPGDDYRDLMAAVDTVVRRGYVDTNKLGVTGGSGGGLLTNWVVGHTRRFAAAVSQRDIADWTAWWYSADILFFFPNWFRAPPFDDPDDYRRRSPITYIKNVTTPLMLVLGDSDTRTPPEAGGEQMFRALKYRHVPTVMVRFPNETHELSRSGQPRHRVERLDHIAGWFDHWLLGVPKPEYEVTQ